MNFMLELSLVLTDPSEKRRITTTTPAAKTSSQPSSLAAATAMQMPTVFIQSGNPATMGNSLQAGGFASHPFDVVCLFSEVLGEC